MTQGNKYLEKVAEQDSEAIAAAEQAAREARFNDVLGRHQAKVEGMRAEQAASKALATKVGLGLGAAGLVGAGAYAIHRHNQEKQASFGVLARDTAGDIASKTQLGVLDDVSRYVKQMGNSNAEGKALNEGALVSAVRRVNPLYRRSYQHMYNAPANRSYSDLRKIAETYSMPLNDAIKEHKDLTQVLKSNDRKAELKELKEQGEELKGMLSRAKAS